MLACHVLGLLDNDLRVARGEKKARTEPICWHPFYRRLFTIPTEKFGHRNSNLSHSHCPAKLRSRHSYRRREGQLV
jgi:hypothetical protein